MGIIIKKQNVINYFYLSILDKVLYKLYVFEKKRIKSNKYSDIVSRSKSLEKYLNKIIKVLNKAALDNESLN